MAWDHTLARWLPPGRGVVRLYGWVRPTLALGRNEPALGIVDPARLRSEGVGLVRRPTGGRSVLHHREVTYAVVAPIRSLGGARAAYRSVNRGLADGLAALGVPVTLATSGPALPPDAGPCFREAAEGEVVSGGRKLVGSAQVKMGTALLQHGSVLLEGGQELLDHVRSGPTDPSGATHRPVGIREILGRPVTVDEVTRAVAGGLRGALPGDWRPIGPGASLEETDLPSDPAPDLLARYRSPEWSWRR